MLDKAKIISRELWNLLSHGGKETFDEIMSIKSQAERIGTLEDRMRAALRASSLGYFGNKIYFFNGRLYDYISDEEFQNMLFELMYNKMRLPKMDYSSVYPMVLRCRILVKSKRLQVNNNMMVFRNGVLDTDEGKFHKTFSKDYVQMWEVSYDYDPKAKTFLWHQFINQVLPDKYLQDALQMFLGATFIDRNKVRIENILLLLGKGANGKGVINSVVLGVLGDYVGSKSIASLCTRGIDGEEALASINGKRLNFCTEMSAADFRRKDARLKSIVSGERTSARFRYERGFDAENIPLLMSSANMLPYFDTKDDALIRRIYPIPFDIVIPEERRNPMLAEELREEYPGILNWILEGREKFIENGYKLPPEIHMKDLLRSGRAQHDNCLVFMARKGWKPCIAGVSMTPKNTIKQKVLYDMYCEWCDDNGSKPNPRQTFYQSLEDAGYQKRRFNDGWRFFIFGDITINTLRRENGRKRAREGKTAATSVIWIDGEAWIMSMRGLASYSGVGEAIIRRLIREGRFKEYTKAFRERRLFNVKGCCQVLRDLRFIASDEEKEIQGRIRKELKYMRYSFNQKMEYNGLPYRKYGSEYEQIDNNIIVVPDEMADYEVFERAEKELGFDMTYVDRGRNNAQGLYGRGGKGFLDSADDRVTDEEKEVVEHAEEVEITRDGEMKIG